MPAPKRTTGRPSEIGKATVRKRLVTALANGLSHRHACAYAGISESAFYKWLRSETPPHDMTEQAFEQFKDDITRASDKGVADLTEKIAVNPDWRAQAWLLERRHPNLFGKVDRLEHSGPNGGPIASVKLDELPDDVIALLAEAAERVGDLDDEEGEA